MSNYLIERLAIVEFIFLLPSLIMGFSLNLFKRFVLGKKIDESKKELKIIYYFLSLIAWLAIGSWLIYQNQFIDLTYVYACSTNDVNGCYKVRADYIPKDCEDTEWDTRGAHSGSCTDPYIEKIYFDDGDFINFENCDMVNKDKWTCYADDENNTAWNLQISEVIKTEKE